MPSGSLAIYCRAFLCGGGKDDSVRLIRQQYTRRKNQPNLTGLNFLITLFGSTKTHANFQFYGNSLPFIY